MDKQPPPNLFREVHKQVRELRDRIREKREGDIQRQEAKEAKFKEQLRREGFERE